MDDFLNVNLAFVGAYVLMLALSIVPLAYRVYSVRMRGKPWKDIWNANFSISLNLTLATIVKILGLLNSRLFSTAHDGSTVAAIVGRTVTFEFVHGLFGFSSFFQYTDTMVNMFSGLNTISGRTYVSKVTKAIHVVAVLCTILFGCLWGFYSTNVSLESYIFWRRLYFFFDAGLLMFLDPILLVSYGSNLISAVLVNESSRNDRAGIRKKIRRMKTQIFQIIFYCYVPMGISLVFIPFLNEILEGNEAGLLYSKIFISLIYWFVIFFAILQYFIPTMAIIMFGKKKEHDRHLKLRVPETPKTDATARNLAPLDTTIESPL
ncbi:hypothetical protein HDV03_003243 [Kappamyces sp. JEL0829]|nr:hypothetical protein HDV03_003243 [Kappamyces sp. JEL0829]